MRTGSITDKGITRDNNEDNLFIDIKKNIFVVADGVGGQNAGEIASSLACRVISDYLIEKKKSSIFTKKQIFAFHNEGIEKANQEILKKSQDNPVYAGMATTAVVATIERNVAFISNVGDSRAYHISKDKMTQITEDHTLANKFIREGRLTAEEVTALEKSRAMPGIFNTITRALGDEMGVQADNYAVSLKKGDAVLLCSDGLYGEVSDEEIEAIIRNSDNPQSACEQLVKTANSNGGKDNITVILVENRN